jgi:serine/threonine-protein kinase
VIGVGLALCVIAGLAIALLRKRPIPPLAARAISSQPSREAQQPPGVKPFPNAQPSVNPEFLVLVGVESTPPGANIVRVSDGYLLGRAPDTVEFHQSNEPVQLRFEMEGFVPVTRVVSVLSDSELKIVLKESPNKHAPATTTLKGRK